MPYTLPSQDELMKRINARLGIVEGARAPDDPLAGPVRVKGPSELPGYTQETPGQESARITGEYNRAGSNNRTAYQDVSEFVTSIPMGAATGLATLGSTVIDPAAAYMGYGTPITNRLVQNNRLLQEGGEGGVDSFVRNVVSSVVSNTAAAVGGTLVGGPVGGAISVGAVNAVPTAMQQYQIGREEGLTDIQAKSRAAAYGVVAGTVSTVVEKILPGTTSAIANSFAQNVAKDIAPGLTRAIFSRLARTSVSEGAEESVQEIANQFIDAATTEITGNKNLEKPYASFTERLADIGQAFAMGAAAGGLIQGGVELVNTRRAIQEIGQQPVQQQPQAPVAPVAPTPMPQNPIAPVNPAPQPQPPMGPQPAPVAPIQPQPTPAEPIEPQAARPGDVPIYESVRDRPPVSTQTPAELAKELAGPTPSETARKEALGSILRDRPVRPQAETAAPPVDPVAEVPYIPKYNNVREILNTLSPEVIRNLAEVKSNSLDEVAKALGVEVGGKEWREYFNAYTNTTHKSLAGVARKAVRQEVVNLALAATDAEGANQDPILQSRAYLSMLSPETRQKIAELKAGQKENLASVLGVDTETYKSMGFLKDARARTILTKVAKQMLGDQPATQDLRPSQDVTGPQESPDAPKEVKVAAAPLREFLTAISPEQKKAIATTPVTSRQSFAKILGVDANQLPDAIKSDRGRAAAKLMAQKDMQAPAPSPEQAAAQEDRSQWTRPTQFSEVLPTGAERPGTASIPRTTNPNFTGPESAETTTIQEIKDVISKFAKKVTGFNTPISEGVAQNRPGKIGFGEFDPVTGGVRVMNRNIIPVIAHELAHSIDTTTKLFKSAPAKAIEEMRRIGASRNQKDRGPLAGNTGPDQIISEGGSRANYKPSQYVREGAADFIRMYIQEGPEAANKLAPTLYAHFVGEVSTKYPSALKELDKATKLYSTFTRDMNAPQRVGSQISPPETISEQVKKFVSDAPNSARSVRRNFWNIAEVINEVAAKYKAWSKAVTGTERELPPEARPDNVLTRIFGQAAAHLKAMVLEKMVDLDGRSTGGKALRDILERLGGTAESVENFMRYLVARRTLAIGDPGQLAKLNEEMVATFGEQATVIGPRSGPVSIADARATVKLLEEQNPEFENIAAEYYQWWDGVMDYVASASPTLAAQVARIRAYDPGAYTPMLRIMEETGTANPVAGAQSGQIGRRLKGSNRAVRDVLMQAVMVAEARISVAHNRMFLESITALTDVHGGFAWGMDEFIEKLQPGEKPDGPTIDILNEQGDKVRYQINDPAIVDMMTALDPVSIRSIPTIGPAVDLLFGRPGRVLKTFATQFNPRFAVVVQPAFNIIELMLKGSAFADRYGAKNSSSAIEGIVKRAFNQGKLLADWVPLTVARMYQAGVEAAGGRITPESIPSKLPFLKPYLEWLERAKQEGVEFTTSIRNDESAAYELSRLAAGVNKTGVFRNPVKVVAQDGAVGLLRWMQGAADTYSTFINASEYAAKASVLKNWMEARGFDSDADLNMRQQAEMSRAVKESFGNYALRGKTDRYLEKMFPYSTVTRVHARGLVEAIKEDPVNAMVAGAAILVPSIILTMVNLEDEEYQEADPEQKIRYVHFGNGKDGWVLMPGYSEALTIFHGMGVAIGHLLRGSNAWPEFQGIVTSMAKQMTGFDATAPLINEIRSQTSGVDVRTGRALVPNYKDRREGDVQATVVSQRPASEQYTKDTARYAIGIGKVTGLSPMRVQHAIDSLTGGLFSGIDAAVTGRKSPLSVFGPRTREPGLLSMKDQSTTDLYAEIQKANERKNDPTQKESPLHREQRLMLESADSARDAYTALMRREKDQEKVNEYSRLQRSLSRTAVTMYRAGEYSHSPFRVAKRIADVESARLDKDDAEVAKLVYNGIDGLMRSRPVKAGQGKTMAETVAAWEEDRAEAQALRDALGIPKAELMKLAQEHMRATGVPAKLMIDRMKKMNQALK